MRIGVIADVHANLLALEAVFEDGDRLGVQEWIGLGDLVGYGPQPRQCLQACTARGVRNILGNHEARLLGMQTVRFNAMAEAAIEFAADQLGEEGRAQLLAFGSTIEFEDEALFCHGSPSDRDLYLFGLGLLQAVHEQQRHPLVFVGHTHQQFVYDGREVTTSPGDYPLAGRSLLVNPGSVGQPRDGDARAAYAVWARNERELWMRRVEYDVAEQVRRTLDAGLPRHLALRLEVGR